LELARVKRTGYLRELIDHHLRTSNGLPFVSRVASCRYKSNSAVATPMFDFLLARKFLKWASSISLGTSSQAEG
jgi:hypothetical protein